MRAAPQLAKLVSADPSCVEIDWDADRGDFFEDGAITSEWICASMQLPLTWRPPLLSSPFHMHPPTGHETKCDVDHRLA